MMEELWHLKSVEETLFAFETTKHGLSTQEALVRQSKYGLNQLETSKGPSLWTVFGRQLINPLILILIIASVIKLLSGYMLDGIVLAITILLMAFIGFFQEVRAERAMRALKKLSAHKSKVKRNGKTEILPSENLVPGDLIFFEMGDKIPADARLIDTKNLKIDESMLNGESMPSEKYIEPLSQDQPLADRKNMVYAGTVVAYGKGIAVVIATGMSTELGKIAQTLKEIKPEKTPLQKSIHSIGNWMLLIIFLALLIFISISIYKGIVLLDIFFLTVAAAVSAVPEGLPVAFTATLAKGMHLIFKKNAIIRKLIAVETLGSTTTICSDKTGTLTLNQMTITTISSFGKKINLAQQELDLEKEPIFRKILEIGSLCNDALISKENDRYTIVGDPTEGAILAAASKMRIDQNYLNGIFPRIGEIPFLSENLYMATLHSSEKGRLIFVKGAPEKLLSMCSSVLTDKGAVLIDSASIKAIERSIEEMTSNALRLIAVGYLETDPETTHLKPEIFEGKLIFAGILGMIDPPRKEVVESISLCKKAGIHVVMITGDNPMTAKAIAKDLGISTTEILTGKDLQSIDDDQLMKKIKDVSVFARIEPIQKLKIVKAFQSSGQIVAMTGDGVNDAPALEVANIGIAMGITGTDVAKEAADMILADDRFDSIVAAVEEGRAIFNRLRNVTTFLLTTCFGELLGLILNVFFIGTAPLTPLQILWVNLVSGSVIAIPLGFEPKTGDEMNFPPRKLKSTLIYTGMIYRIAFIATLLGVGSFFIFKYTHSVESLEKARTIVLTSLVAFEWLIALNMRSPEIPLRKLGIFKNPSLILAIISALGLHLCILYTPFFQKLFVISPLSLKEWAIALIPGTAIFLLETLRKEFLPKLFSKNIF